MNENNEKNQPSYFSILTAEVRYDKDLSSSEKIFYSEITALCNFKGYCYASNNYFSQLYDVNSRCIQKWLKSLLEKKYILIDYSNNQRVIKIKNNKFSNIKFNKSGGFIEL